MPRPAVPMLVPALPAVLAPVAATGSESLGTGLVLLVAVLVPVLLGLGGAAVHAWWRGRRRNREMRRVRVALETEAHAQTDLPVRPTSTP